MILTGPFLDLNLQVEVLITSNSLMMCITWYDIIMLTYIAHLLNYNMDKTKHHILYCNTSIYLYNCVVTIGICYCHLNDCIIYSTHVHDEGIDSHKSTIFTHFAIQFLRNSSTSDFNALKPHSVTKRISSPFAVIILIVTSAMALNADECILGLQNTSRLTPLSWR